MINRKWIAIAAIAGMLGFLAGQRALSPDHGDQLATPTPSTSQAGEAAAPVTVVPLPAATSSTTPADPGPEQAEADTVPSVDLDEHHHTDSDEWPSGKPVPSPTPVPSWLASTTRTPAALPSAKPVQIPSDLPRGAATWTAPDLSNPTAVGAAFVQRYNTIDAATDPTPWAGPARAAVFATRTYAAALGNYTLPGDSETWTRLQASKGYTTVAVTRIAGADQPDDTTTTAYRAYALDITNHDPDGTTTTTHTNALVKLTHTASTWQVSAAQPLE